MAMAVIGSPVGLGPGERHAPNGVLVWAVCPLPWGSFGLVEALMVLPFDYFPGVELVSLVFIQGLHTISVTPSPPPPISYISLQI